MVMFAVDNMGLPYKTRRAFYHSAPGQQSRARSGRNIELAIDASDMRVCVLQTITASVVKPHLSNFCRPPFCDTVPQMCRPKTLLAQQFYCIYCHQTIRATAVSNDWYVFW